MGLSLLIDLGNSRCKWALSEPGQPLGLVQAIAHEGRLATVLDGLPAAAVSQIAIAQVWGAAAGAELVAALEARYAAPVLSAATQAEWRGLRVAYAQPGRLGVDRWLMLCALWAEQTGSFVVASAGTALTLDAVDATGQHLGGFIAPGLQTALQATLGATRFDTADLAAPCTGQLGCDTESCVREGACFAALGALERGAAHAPATARRVLTGGDAAVLHPMLSGWTLRPDLVLEGLRALAT